MTVVTPRFGLELELCCGDGFTRDDVARSIATAIGGRVLFGLKHLVDGELAPGRPRCVLRRACRIEDEHGRWWGDVVDDPTLRDVFDDDDTDDAAPDGPDGPHPPAPSPRGRGGAEPGDLAVVLDDTRLAKWLESKSFQPDPAFPACLAPLLSTFSGTVQDGRVVDPWGQVLAVVEPSPRAFLRACEIVLAPRARVELDDAVATALTAAAAARCTIPSTAALHVHLDAAPFVDVVGLARLITGWNADREHHLDALGTNRRCLRLGPFPALVERVAREALSSSPQGAARSPMPWATFAAGLAMAGAHKACDINIRGVIDTRPVQPTLELRCLPMSTDAADVLARVDAGVALLASLSAPNA